MANAILAFITYLAMSVILLGAFLFIYVWVTPYKEFKLISEGNCAAAITLTGAVLGFTFPLMSSIYYTQSVREMMLWAAITCVVQLLVFLGLRKQAKHIEEGRIAPALMVATFSVAIGLLNAVSISH